MSASLTLVRIRRSSLTISWMSSSVLAAISARPSLGGLGLGLGLSEERGLAGCLVPLLSCPVLGLLAEHLALCGARRAAGLAWHCGIRAVYTDPDFLHLPPVFLSMASLVFLTLQGLGSLPFVLASALLPGFYLGWGWHGTAFRPLGFGSGLRLRFADGGFPWRFSGWGLPGLGTMLAVVLWELEGVLEKTFFCRGGAPESFNVSNVPICPGPVPGRWVRGLGPGCCQRNVVWPDAWIFCWAAFSLALLCHRLREPLCRSAHASHLVWSGIAGWWQSLHRPAAFA